VRRAARAHGEWECTTIPFVSASNSATRAATNESVFRQLNEQLDAAATGSSSDVNGFVCECANIACTAIVAVPLGEYQEVRRHAERFIVAPDEAHVDRAIEEVVGVHEEYWVVEKRGTAGAVAEQLDPNS
jgi:hypothetical protein